MEVHKKGIKPKTKGIILVKEKITTKRTSHLYCHIPESDSNSYRGLNLNYNRSIFIVSKNLCYIYIS